MTQDIPAWVSGKLKPVDKLRVHREGLRHPAVSVFVIDGGRTLLQRRALGKYHTPGLWANACCTHPHWGERSEDCARRRLSEELGIEDATLIPRETVEYRADVGGGLIEHEVVSMFLLRGRPKLAPNPDEVMETAWVPLRSLAETVEARPATYTPWLRIYVRDHGHQIFGEGLGLIGA